MGSGGREHALAWKLSQEAEVVCTPGNPGIAEDVTCIALQSADEISRFCLDHEIDLVVVGPEDPLIAGLADHLREHEINVLGPGKLGAQLEGSKAFSKAMMERAGVPTAKYYTEHTSEGAKEACRRMFANGSQVAVKASGNALGKGVVVCETLEQAIRAVDELKSLGSAGETLVIEERLIGREFSLLTLVAGEFYQSLPVAQDYKRVNDGDQGPNTGGMGTYSPVEWVDEELVRQTEAEIVVPLLAEMIRQGIDYRGVLFSGIMQTEAGLKCLEYNVRFGDPETQSVMMRLGPGLAEALLATATGGPIPPITVRPVCVTTVVAASEGYPGIYPKGIPIEFGEIPKGVKVFHAGTQRLESDHSWVTSGGRVLAVTAEAPTSDQSRQLAYQAMEQIQFAGMHYRTDIGRRNETC